MVDGALDLPFQFRAQVVAEQRIAQVTGFLCVDFTTLLALVDVAELANRLAFICGEIPLLDVLINTFSGTAHLSMFEPRVGLILFGLSRLQFAIGDGAILEGLLRFLRDRLLCGRLWFGGAGSSSTKSGRSASSRGSSSSCLRARLATGHDVDRILYKLEVIDGGGAHIHIPEQTLDQIS